MRVGSERHQRVENIAYEAKHDAIRGGRSCGACTYNHKRQVQKQEPQRNKEAIGGDDTRGQGKESIGGRSTEADKSFTEEEGPRHVADIQEQTVRKAMQIGTRRGRTRLPRNKRIRGRAIRTPYEPEQRNG